MIFISSVASHQANRDHPVSAYGATKYAVRGLAQQVAAEYASYGIRANSILPGYTLLSSPSSCPLATPWENDERK